MAEAADPPATPFAIGPATDRDLQTFAALAREGGVPGWSEGSLRSVLSDPNAIARVARRAGSDASGFVLARCAADEVEVLIAAVAGPMRRAGIGTALVSAALDEAARTGARTAHLEVRASNAAAIALYERLGFVAVGRRPRYYGATEDAVLMSRALGSEFA